MTANFFQISMSDDPDLEFSPNKNNILDIFEDIDYKIFSLNKIISLMQNNGDTHVLDAMNALNPYAYKTDLAKYYLLYNYGGWYSDVNNYFTGYTSNAEIEDDSPFFGFYDIPEHAGSEFAFTISIFYSISKNIIFKKAIDQIIINTQNKKYGINALDITGPIMFGEIVKKHLKKSYRLGNFKFNEDQSNRFFEYDDKVFANYKPYYDFPGHSNIPGGNSYVDMWNNNEVYQYSV